MTRIDASKKTTRSTFYEHGMSSAKPVINVRIPLAEQPYGNSEQVASSEYIYRLIHGNNSFFLNYVPTFRNVELGQKPKFIALVPIFDEKTKRLLTCSPNYMFCQGVGDVYYVTKLYEKDSQTKDKSFKSSLHTYTKASVLFALNHLGSKIILNFYPFSALDDLDYLISEENQIISLCHKHSHKNFSLINIFYDPSSFRTEIVNIKVSEEHTSLVQELRLAHSQFYDNFYVKLMKSVHDSTKSVIITCSDSRVVPELIFDLPLSHALVIRLEANITKFVESDFLQQYIQSILREIEQSGIKKGISNIILLGHKNCMGVIHSTQNSEKEIKREPEELVKIFLDLKYQLQKISNNNNNLYSFVRKAQSTLLANDFSFLHMAIQYYNLVKIISSSFPSLLTSTNIYGMLYDLYHGQVADHTKRLKEIIDSCQD